MEFRPVEKYANLLKLKLKSRSKRQVRRYVYESILYNSSENETYTEELELY